MPSGFSSLHSSCEIIQCHHYCWKCVRFSPTWNCVYINRCGDRSGCRADRLGFKPTGCYSELQNCLLQHRHLNLDSSIQLFLLTEEQRQDVANFRMTDGGDFNYIQYSTLYLKQKVEYILIHIASKSYCRSYYRDSFQGTHSPCLSALFSHNHSLTSFVLPPRTLVCV